MEKGGSAQASYTQLAAPPFAISIWSSVRVRVGFASRQEKRQPCVAFCEKPSPAAASWLEAITLKRQISKACHSGCPRRKFSASAASSVPPLSLVNVVRERRGTTESSALRISNSSRDLVRAPPAIALTSRQARSRVAASLDRWACECPSRSDSRSRFSPPRPVLSHSSPSTFLHPFKKIPRIQDIHFSAFPKFSLSLEFHRPYKKKKKRLT